MNNILLCHFNILSSAPKYFQIDFRCPEIFLAFVITPMHAAWSSLLILINFITLILYGVQHNLWSPERFFLLNCSCHCKYVCLQYRTRTPFPTPPPPFSVSKAADIWLFIPPPAEAENAWAFAAMFSIRLDGLSCICQRISLCTWIVTTLKHSLYFSLQTAPNSPPSVILYTTSALLYHATFVRRNV